ncbi:MAG: HXXEE domain-containing protein [Pseudomonadota bacterium]
MAHLRLDRLAANWVYGGVLAAVILLALTPLLADGRGWVFLLTWLCLPVYMIHQYEEHDDDRFRSFVNDMVPAGRAGLTIGDVFFVNFVGVWVLLAATLWLTVRLDPGWATLALYLVGINALVHVGQAAGRRDYNPGLATSVALFLPLALALAAVVPASLVQHLLSAAAIVALHAAILARAMRKAPRAPHA